MKHDERDNGGGHEGPSSDPPEPLPDPGTAVEKSYPICGAIKSQGGDPCTQKAGWGTDHVGIGQAARWQEPDQARSVFGCVPGTYP